jgi:hypothetical protein
VVVCLVDVFNAYFRHGYVCWDCSVIDMSPISVTISIKPMNEALVNQSKQLE